MQTDFRFVHEKHVGLTVFHQYGQQNHEHLLLAGREFVRRKYLTELLQLYFIAAADVFLSGLAEQLVHHILKLHPGLSRHFRLFPCLGVAARQQCNHTVAHIDLIVQETPLQEIKLPVQLGSHPVIR